MRKILKMFSNQVPKTDRLTYISYLFLGVIFCIWFTDFIGLLQYRSWTFFDIKALKNGILDSNPGIPISILIVGILIKYLPIISTLLFLGVSIIITNEILTQGINIGTSVGNEEVQVYFFIVLITIVLVRRQFLFWKQRKKISFII